MERSEKIPIRNIYYMLSYAYQTLSLSEYKNMDTEQFKNISDLYAEILSIGIPVLIRGGLSKDYVSIHESSTVIRGKLDINSTIKTNALISKKVAVIYDDFSQDILVNQIIKASLLFLSRTSKISRQKRRQFHGLLPYFSKVSNVELHPKLWKKVVYNRQNIRYQFILDICRYLYEELLFDESNSSDMQHELNDEQRLSSLFEKFVFAFYKRESHYSISHPQIQWGIDNDFYDALPIMQTDLVLQANNKTLIIDTKFYSENMSMKFEGGAAKQKSSNLYQIFTYVNNWTRKPDELVAGMLLYAKTTAEIQPQHNYHIKGNPFYVISLDLSQDFISIKKDLIRYAQLFLN